MEFSSPTIGKAVIKLSNKGIKKIVLVNSPGIFMRSSHSLLDIPPIIENIRSEYSNLEFIYAPPGGFLEEIADVIIKRIDDALGKPCAECQIKDMKIPDEFDVVQIGRASN